MWRFNFLKKKTKETIVPSITKFAEKDAFDIGDSDISINSYLKGWCKVFCTFVTVHILISIVKTFETFETFKHIINSLKDSELFFVCIKNCCTKIRKIIV